MKAKALLLAVAGITLSGLSSTSEAALVMAGPMRYGHPEWFMDSNGTALSILTAADRGISDPIEAGNAYSQQIGYGGEAFWWAANAAIDDGTLDIRFVLGQEAAFFGAGSPYQGDEIAFGRVRVDVRGGPQAQYRITDPWGRTFMMNTAVDDRYVSDNGDLYPYRNDGRLLSYNMGSPARTDSNVSTFLRPADPDDYVVINGETYLGDPTDLNAVPVVGEGLGWKVEQLNAAGTAVVQTWTTNEYDFVGKIKNVPALVDPDTGDVYVYDSLNALMVKPVHPTTGAPAKLIVQGANTQLNLRDIYGDVQYDGGVINPGNSPGIQTVTGNSFLSPATTLLIEIDGLAGAGVNPGGHDQYQVTGNLSLNGATLNLDINYEFTEADLNTPFTIVTYGGTLTGTFGNLPAGYINVPTEWATYRFDINYGDRNVGSIIATLTAVPEPAVVGAAALAASLSLLRRSRKPAR